MSCELDIKADGKNAADNRKVLRLITGIGDFRLLNSNGNMGGELSQMSLAQKIVRMTLFRCGGGLRPSVTAGFRVTGETGAGSDNV